MMFETAVAAGIPVFAADWCLAWISCESNLARDVLSARTFSGSLL